jgi:uncharacterized protein (DUF2141 family)
MYFIETMKKIITAIFLLTAVLMAQNALNAKTDSSLRISGTITGFSGKSSLFLALFSSEAGFKQQKYVKSLRIKQNEITTDSMRFEFKDMLPGRYMIAAFEDVNGNRMLDKGLFGRPVEPYCFCSPYRGMFAPNFSACSFLVEQNVENADLRF